MKIYSVMLFLVSMNFCCYALGNPAFSQIEYDAMHLRDPFEPQLPKGQAPALMPQKMKPLEEVKPPQLKVEGIITGGPIPQAIIKGKVVRAGDRIEDAQIISITKEGVEVLYHEKTFFYPSPSKLLKYSKGERDGK